MDVAVTEHEQKEMMSLKFDKMTELRKYEHLIWITA